MTTMTKTKFTKFDRATCRALRAELQEVMNKYASKANLDIEVGHMSFDVNDVKIKVNAKIKGAKSHDQKNLEMFARLDGITKFVNSNGDKLLAFKPRSPKYPYVYQCGADGKMYKASTSTAKYMFK